MYIIKKTDKEITSARDSAWGAANVAVIEQINWPEYSYAPRTTAKLLYDDKALYVRFETEEQPLLATHTRQNSDVCEDSCMELFLRPNASDPRYINLEWNPFGTMYCGVRTSREHYVLPKKDRSFFRVQTDVTEWSWQLQFSLPFAWLDAVCGAHTEKMYGNLYKCGEKTEREHYVTYYPVRTEKPDFHRPEFFGEFILG